MTSPLLQQTSFISSSSFLPPAIWVEPWVAPSSSSQGFYSIDTLSQSVFDAAATGITVSKLEVHQPTVAALAKAFDVMLGEAAVQGDFSQILSPDRGFFV
jgi:hypothetical protein